MRGARGRLQLADGHPRSSLNGHQRQGEHDVEAKDIKELCRNLADSGREPWIDRGIAVATEGTIYRQTGARSCRRGRRYFCCRDWRGMMDG
ncbi:hypothetical protein MPLA_1430003 [Mesorhizobium sp. ORS 3359]|nr:hypothetical protein MPLA_1430003 [Mesorhizobium sp. ORS 3359]